MPRYNGGFIGTDGLDAPDAPTIGTPTAGSAQADIAFTAGAAGTTATTEFVATTNDGIGATGTSSPITITGLTNGTSYTARVYAKNSHGTSAASEASASFTPIAEVINSLFSTHLYLGGVSTPLTINNGIDLSGEGGLVWIKNRDSGVWHQLADTERGANKMLSSNVTNGEISRTEHVKSFTSTGFTVGNDNDVNYDVIGGSQDDKHVSWTFRKAPKFFDIQTWTGNGTAGRTISHDLGSDPGMVIVKRTDSTQNWVVHHRSLTSTKYLALNLTNGEINGSDVTATSSTNITISDSFNTNGSGATYVGYFFAHNNNDGGFGPDSEDIIKCGSYTGDGTTDGSNEVTLGFEPQWILTKRSDSTDNWHICDVMREQTADGSTARLRANTAAAESSNFGAVPTATGFKLYSDNTSGGTFIYMAIRRPDHSTPTVASEVFAIDTRGASEPSYDSGFPVDLGIIKEVNSTGDWFVGSRLIQGKYLQTNTTNAEASASSYVFDYMDGWNSTTGSNSNLYSWMWKRARGFCDVVAYSGNGSTQNVSHNLGAVPEMMWIKTRDAAGTEWKVYHSAIGNTKELILNSTALSATASSFNNTTPTSSVFSVSGGATNDSAYDFIAFLFATVAGVSKVGSYTGTGTAGLNVDCGFSNGARFILIKRATGTASYWAVFDSVRGIVSGNDPFLRLNDTNAETTSIDAIDPYSAGFTVATDFSFLNNSGDTYVFYAIANDPS